MAGPDNKGGPGGKVKCPVCNALGRDASFGNEQPGFRRKGPTGIPFLMDAESVRRRARAKAIRLQNG